MWWLYAIEQLCWHNCTYCILWVVLLQCRSPQFKDEGNVKSKDQLFIQDQFLYMPADEVLMSCFPCVLLMQQIMCAHSCFPLPPWPQMVAEVASSFNKRAKSHRCSAVADVHLFFLEYNSFLLVSVKTQQVNFQIKTHSETSIRKNNASWPLRWKKILVVFWIEVAVCYSDTNNFVGNLECFCKVTMCGLKIFKN